MAIVDWQSLNESYTTADSILTDAIAEVNAIAPEAPITMEMLTAPAPTITSTVRVPLWYKRLVTGRLWKIYRPVILYAIIAIGLYAFYFIDTTRGASFVMLSSILMFIISFCIISILLS